MRIATANVYGLREVRVHELCELWNIIRPDVCAIQEVWMTEEDNKRVNDMWEERGKKWIGKMRSKKNNHNRYNKGGIGVIYERDLQVKSEGASKHEGLMWVSVKCEGVSLFICNLYQVPSTSNHSISNNELMEELESDIIKYKECGIVVVVGDMNAEIGEMSQVFQESEEEDIEYKRQSTNTKTNAYGRKLVELASATDMVIGNGIMRKGVRAQPTTRKGSVIDFILYDRKYEHIMSAVYASSTDFGSDHYLVYMDVDVSALKYKSECEHEQHHNNKVHDQHPRYVWKVKDGDYKKWNELCDTQMEECCEQICECGMDYEKAWGVFRNTVIDAAKTTFQHKQQHTTHKKERKRKMKVKNPSPELLQLIEKRKVQHDEAKSTNEWNEYNKTAKKVRRKAEREAKKEMKEKRKEVMSELHKNPKRGWALLNQITSNPSKKMKKNTITQMKDEKGNVFSDKYNVQRIFNTATKKLLNEDGDVKSYDEEFKKYIDEQLKMMETQESENQQHIHEYRETEERAENEESENKVSELNEEIERDEVQTVMKKLVNNKAPGVDSITSEMLKYGGERMVECVFKLCQCVFHAERVPDEWMEGMITPIYKDGDPLEPGNYRGITLLSIVGKVYASVLNNRLMSWCERRGVLVDEQAGFRAGRSTSGQMFTLTEIIRMRKRKHMSTFCAFIDLRKAYDRVWRDGLWVKLHNYGIQGRMWRVLKKLYDKVQSTVLVNGEMTDWFDVTVGLRQGCVLSPVLFDLFINAVAEELRESECGVTFADTHVSILLFADDIVLVAPDAIKLQQMLNHVSDYCSRWRCDVNVKKTEVVVFGPESNNKSFVFTMHGKALEQKKGYKYLGLDVYVSLRWNVMRSRLYAKARSKLSYALSVHNCHDVLNVGLAVQLWKTLIRPCLEYGCEIWGDTEWKEAEQLQRLAAKRILHCSSNTTNEAVLGELGWWSMRARFDLLRLRFWGKVVNMPLESVVKRVYNESAAAFEMDYKWLFHRPPPQLSDDEKENKKVMRKYMQPVREAKRNNWCAGIYECLQRYGLLRFWDYGFMDVHWFTQLKNVIHAYEQLEWKKRMEMKDKLRTYRTLKTELVMEPYLILSDGEKSVYDLFKIRNGTNVLRVETGRFSYVGGHRTHLDLPLRKCLVCASGQVEDEKHFILHCSAYGIEREQCFRRLREHLHGKITFDALNDDERLQIVLLADSYSRVLDDIMPIVKQYVEKIYAKRQRYNMFLM
jgi:exonuclease III